MRGFVIVVMSPLRPKVINKDVVLPGKKGRNYEELKPPSLPLVIGLVFATVIWQVGGNYACRFWSKTCLSIFGSAFVELPTMDKNGIPMRYYPSAGKVYDPELIAYKGPPAFIKPAL